MRQLKADVPFIPDEQLEAMANKLLASAATQGINVRFPIPVERIAETVLELDMDWIDLGDTNTMARLNYLEWKIQPNESLRELFDRVPGAYSYTLAHEIFHAIAHVEHIEPSQQRLEIEAEPVLTRRRDVASTPSPRDERREFQAQRFAAYLTMPKTLLVEKIIGLDLCDRAVLRRLAGELGVSMKALTIRLEGLGRVYQAPDGRLYPSKAVANGQLPLL
jgi:hypothetical protein